MRLDRTVAPVIPVVMLLACSGPKEEMSVSGRVLNNANGDPVSGANVTLRAIGGELKSSGYTVGSASATTASSGSFDVTVEVDSDKHHEWATVVIKANGFTTFEAGMPWGDRRDWLVVLEPAP